MPRRQATPRPLPAGGRNFKATASAMSHSSQEIATAYHEAGHAVMALALGRPVQKVTVQPNEVRLGQCEIRKGRFRPSKDVLETEMLILLGGVAAEVLHSGRYEFAGAAQDLRSLRLLAATRAGGEKQIERLERRMLDKAEHVLGRPGNWEAVRLIAEELLSRTTISGRAARHLFERAVSRYRDE